MKYSKREIGLMKIFMSALLAIGLISGIMSILTIDQWPDQNNQQNSKVKIDGNGNNTNLKVYKPNIPLMYMVVSLCFTALSIAGIIGIRIVVKNDGYDKEDSKK